MDDEARKLASERLRIGIQLSDAVLIMRRQRMKRDNPGRTASEIDALLNAELRDRPMDGEGVLREPAVSRPPHGWASTSIGVCYNGEHGQRS